MKWSDIIYSTIGPTANRDNHIDFDKKADEEKDIEVFTELNSSGREIIGVIKNGREYYLNSRYDDEILLEGWCRQTEISNYRTIALVFGMANGDYLRALRKYNKDMLILVWEPSYSIAKINKDIIGIEDFDDDKKMIISLGSEDYSGIYGILGNVVDYETMQYTKLFISPNYDNLFPKEMKEICDIYNECLNRVIFNRNTIVRSGKTMIYNMLGNSMDCIKQYSLKSLIQIFQNIDKKNIPAIIVAAGPSLDKNIHELARAKGKAFIIAVDTALNPLGKAGIIPDIAVTVDPNKDLILFQHEKMCNVPLIFSLSANKQIKNIHHGMRIYQNHESSILDMYFRKYEKERVSLETGGSVANDAFSLAQKLGFQTIIFVGQDLAYPDDKEHSEASYENAEFNDIKNKEKKYFEVEDIYGGKVKTEYNMNMYRIWFERAVMVYPEIKFIDATEGGAKKQGMEILTLKEAIDRECTIDKEIDFWFYIKQTEKNFNEDEQKSILEDIVNFPKLISKIRQKIQNGLQTYAKLEELNLNKVYQGDKFDKIIQQVTEVNDWITEDADIAYLHMYIAEKDYQVRGVILEEKEDISDEFNLIIDNGKKLLNALLEATEVAEADMKEVIEQAKATY